MAHACFIDDYLIQNLILNKQDSMLVLTCNVIITACKEDFASKNYTIITNKCKGPNYPAKACCSAFKDFACPFAEALNDEKTECASTMFSYINIYGRYPPGIFANMCKEGKEGLDCTDVMAATSSSYAVIPLVSTHALLFTVLLFCLF